MSGNEANVISLAICAGVILILAVILESCDIKQRCFKTKDIPACLEAMK